MILENVDDYWQHYREQAASPTPVLDPARSRGGIHELELAIDVMSAYYNDAPATLPVNLLNTGGVLPGFDEDTVVEVWCTVDGRGATPLPQQPLPHAVRGITQQLAEYQRLAAVAAWDGDRADAVRALAAHPFVPTLPVAEELYDDLAHANRDVPAGAPAAVSRCYLGVDAGNSKTVALLADADGRVLGRGRAGVGDIYGVPDAEDAVDAVLDAVRPGAGRRRRRGRRRARTPPSGWPGSTGHEDEAFWTAALARRLPALRRASVRNDGLRPAALRAALRGRRGGDRRHRTGRLRAGTGRPRVVGGLVDPARAGRPRARDGPGSAPSSTPPPGWGRRPR